MTQIQALISLPSGYQRDLQLTKEPLIKSILLSKQVLKLMPGLINALTFNQQIMENAITADLMATDQAFEQVKKGANFRDAYGEAKTINSEINFHHSLKDRVSLGASANLGMSIMYERLKNLEVTG
jgi:argininosuccinate lyase